MTAPRHRDQTPVGATWECVLNDGSIGRVWLARRHDNGHEVWMYTAFHPTDRVQNQDWAPSKDTALKLCRVELAGLTGSRKTLKTRFKRVVADPKETE